MRPSVLARGEDLSRLVWLLFRPALCRLREDGDVEFHVRPSKDVLIWAGDRVWEPVEKFASGAQLLRQHPPERFAPLHTIADALLAYLRGRYDVDEEGVDTAADLLHPSYHDGVRAVRMRPQDPACATVTMVFTAYPGVYMHAGLLTGFHNPVCGCDACDSHWEAEVDELERQVLASSPGTIAEPVSDATWTPWIGYAFTYPDGASSGGTREHGISTERLKTAESILRNDLARWAEWPHVASSS